MDFARNPREQRVTPENNLPFNPGPTNLSVPARPQKEQGPAVPRATVWLHRLSLVIFVAFCIEMGMLLAALPWTQMWNNNGLLLTHPVLSSILHHNFVRGVITGFGLLDIWIGIWEAVRYHDPGAKKK